MATRAHTPSCRRLYRQAFHCIPDDTVSNFQEFNEFRKSPLPDVEQQRKLVLQVKGHLVDFPLRFLSEEKLGDSNMVSTDNFIPADVFL